VLTRALALALLVAAGCGEDDSSSTPDMQASADLTRFVCVAFACVDSCPQGNGLHGFSHCVVNRPTDQYGSCTDGPSTCGVKLTGDCNWQTQCLDDHTMGMLFTPIEGGCGIERYHCTNGCVDPRADGGVGPEAHCL